MKRLPLLLLSMLLAAGLLAGIFGIVYAADIVTVWDFAGGVQGPWTGTGFSVQSETLKFVGSGQQKTELDQGEMLGVFGASSVTAVNVRFSYIYTTSYPFSSTIQMISEGPTVGCNDNNLIGTGTVNCSINAGAVFSGVRVIIKGPLSKTVFFDNLELKVPEGNITAATPTPVPTKVLFPTPVITGPPSFGSIPEPIPIPTPNTTVTLGSDIFWHIPNWEFAISVARTVWTLEYMDELFQLFLYLAGAGIAIALIKAILGGRAASQQQATVIVQGREDSGEMLSDSQRQEAIRQEADNIRRQEIASRFRSEARRTFGGRRGRRR